MSWLIIGKIFMLCFDRIKRFYSSLNAMYNSIAIIRGWYIGAILITVRYANVDAIVWSKTNVVIIFDLLWYLRSRTEMPMIFKLGIIF